MEYKIECFPESIVDDSSFFEDNLNSLGVQGWELISQFSRIKKNAIKGASALNPISVEAEIICIFKRGTSK
jgi:hypothetical protein